jgi:hypothetical protein
VTGTQIDTQLAGDQTDLVKGNTYFWTGYVNVPAADTWTFVLSGPQAPWWGTRPDLTVASTPGIRTSVRGPSHVHLQSVGRDRECGLVLSFPPCQDPSAGGRLARGVVVDITDVADRQLRCFAVLSHLPEDRQCT